MSSPQISTALTGPDRLTSTGEHDRAIDLAKTLIEHGDRVPPECGSTFEACLDRVCNDMKQTRDINISGRFWGQYAATMARGSKLPKGTLNFAIALTFKEMLCIKPPPPPPLPVAKPALKPAEAITASGCAKSQTSTYGWGSAVIFLAAIVTIRLGELAAPETIPQAESLIQSLYLWMGISYGSESPAPLWDYRADEA